MSITFEQRLKDKYPQFQSKDLTHPNTAADLHDVFVPVVSEIRAGERIKITVPHNCPYDNVMDEVHSAIENQSNRSNIFIMIRHTDVFDVVVDICCVTEDTTAIPSAQPSSSAPPTLVSPTIVSPTHVLVISEPIPILIYHPRGFRPVQIMARQLTNNRLLELDHGLLMQRQNNGTYGILGKVADISNPDLTTLSSLTKEDIQFTADVGLCMI